jgi:hypothetical protein
VRGIFFQHLTRPKRSTFGSILDPKLIESLYGLSGDPYPPADMAEVKEDRRFRVLWKDEEFDRSNLIRPKELQQFKTTLIQDLTDEMLKYRCSGCDWCCNGVPTSQAYCETVFGPEDLSSYVSFACEHALTSCRGIGANSDFITQEDYGGPVYPVLEEVVITQVGEYWEWKLVPTGRGWSITEGLDSIDLFQK